MDENTRRKLARILDVNEQDLCDFPLPNNLIQDKFSALTSFFNFSKTGNSEMIAIDVIDMNGEKKGKFDQIKQNLIGKEIITKDGNDVIRTIDFNPTLVNKTLTIITNNIQLNLKYLEEVRELINEKMVIEAK